MRTAARGRRFDRRAPALARRRCGRRPGRRRGRRTTRHPGEPRARQQSRLWKRVRETRNFWETLDEREPGAVRRLQKLAHELRWDVLFVTQRPSTAGRTAQLQTQHWLRRHGFEYPAVYTTRVARAHRGGAHAGRARRRPPQNCVDVATDSKAWPILVWRDAPRSRASAPAPRSSASPSSPPSPRPSTRSRRPTAPPRSLSSRRCSTGCVEHSSRRLALVRRVGARRGAGPAGDVSICARLN